MDSTEVQVHSWLAQNSSDTAQRVAATMGFCPHRSPESAHTGKLCSKHSYSLVTSLLRTNSQESTGSRLARNEAFQQIRNLIKV